VSAETPEGKEKQFGKKQFEGLVQNYCNMIYKKAVTIVLHHALECIFVQKYIFKVTMQTTE